jgi:hypothetical protein
MSSNASVSAKLALALHRLWLWLRLYQQLDTLYHTPQLTIDTEPSLHLPSDPHSHPCDLSFNPHPATPPLTSHGCTSTTIGVDITITSLPPQITFNPLLQMSYILLLTMPTHIYSLTSTGNLVVSTKLIPLLLLSLGATLLLVIYFS